MNLQAGGQAGSTADAARDTSNSLFSMGGEDTWSSGEGFGPAPRTCPPGMDIFSYPQPLKNCMAEQPSPIAHNRLNKRASCPEPQLSCPSHAAAAAAAAAPAVISHPGSALSCGAGPAGASSMTTCAPHGVHAGVSAAGSSCAGHAHAAGHARLSLSADRPSLGAAGEELFSPSNAMLLSNMPGHAAWHAMQAGLASCGSGSSSRDGCDRGDCSMGVGGAFSDGVCGASGGAPGMGNGFGNQSSSQLQVLVTDSEPGVCQGYAGGMDTAMGGAAGHMQPQLPNPFAEGCSWGLVLQALQARPGQALVVMIQEASAAALPVRGW